MISRKRKSRQLWDKTREQNASMMTFVKAVAYELQPIDMSSMAIPPLSEVVEYSTSLTKQAGQVSSRGLKSFAKFLSRRTAKEWAAAITFVGYWKGVVYLHRTLDAGPSVLMITALVIIFSVGLGDTKDGNTLSAYSVFNRGFQNIMGSVNAEDLLAQHVGGGLAAGVAMNNNNVDGIEGPNRNERRRQVRQEPQQQQEEEEQRDQAQEQQPGGRARRSKKKQRNKRDVQQRRDLQEQRRVAAAMGFGDHEMNQDQDNMAMNRLVEDQVQPAHDEI
jgi:hypothetical protein